MIRYNKLHMPEPCLKIHYDALPYDAVKRPCDVCKKPVYDFRDKDEAFLNKIWKQHNGDFCGAFRADQFDEQSIRVVDNFSIKHFRKALLSILLSAWATLSKAGDEEKPIRPSVELYPPDSSLTGKENSFVVMTKECRTCLDRFNIKVSINHVFYNNYYVDDSTTIVLPESVKPTDIITIEELRKSVPAGWVNIVKRTEKVEFSFQERNVVEVKHTSKRRLRFIYKRAFVGTPRFRW